MNEYREIIRRKGLPDAGKTVRSKAHGTLWRVVEKREVWQNTEPDEKSGDAHMVPAFYRTCRRQQEGVRPGAGRMPGYLTLFMTTSLKQVGSAQIE